MANVSLSQSLQSVLSRIESAMVEVVDRVQCNPKGEQLTVSSMTEVLAQETGLDKILLSMVASTVINGSNTHYIVPGRNGGVKEGTRQVKEPKGPSQKAQLLAQLEAAKAELAAIRAKAKVDEEPATTVEGLEQYLSENFAE